MPKVEIQKLVFTKEMMLKLPERERAFLIYAGHISNELNWFNKLNLIFQRTGREIADKLPDGISDEERAALDGNGTNVIILKRLFAGKICESLSFLRKWCFKEVWFEDALATMAEDGKVAYGNIKSYQERVWTDKPSDLLRLVRDKFGFHYDDEAVKASLKAAGKNEEFATYLAQNVGNALYLGSEFAVMDSLVELSDRENAEIATGNLINETLTLAMDINRLIGHILSHLCFKYFGETKEELGFREVLEIDATSLEDIRIPFFSIVPVRSNSKDKDGNVD